MRTARDRFRFGCLLLALLVCIGCLTGCGKAAQQPQRTMPEEALPPIQVPETAATEPAEEQFAPSGEDEILGAQYACIAANGELWREEGSNMAYAVTDLDNNGCLELIAAHRENDGSYAVFQMFEVSPDASRMERVTQNLPQDGIMLCFYGENSCYRCEGTYYFFFEDSRWEGSESFTTTTYAMFKQGNELVCTQVSAARETYDESGNQTGQQYLDASGNMVAEEVYFGAGEAFFGGREYEFDLKFMDWQELSEGSDASLFAAGSYSTFACHDTCEDYGFQVTVYPDPKSGDYQALGTQAELLSGTEFADTSVRFTAADGTQVRLQYGEWIDSLNYFRPISDIFDIAASSGTVYEFPAILSDGNPEYRLVASVMGENAVWYLRRDPDSGSAVELYCEEPQSFLPETDDPIIALCQAYGGMMITAGDESGIFDRYYWHTIGTAARMRNVLNLEPDAFGSLSVPDWLIDGYARAMFPYREEYPLSVPDGPVVPNMGRSGEYLVQDWAAIYDSTTTRCEGVYEDMEGRICVSVAVVTQTGEEGTVVYLEPVTGTDSGNPFGYIISGAEISVG